MPVHVLNHPLAAHIITHLRDQTTKPATFRTLAYQLSLLLAIEATRDIETEAKSIQTPLEQMQGRVLAQELLARRLLIEFEDGRRLPVPAAEVLTRL